jgi:hypothetical protein
MRKLSWFGVLLGLSLVLGSLARADDSGPPPSEWQAVIAGQIQAFRLHDAPGVLKFAGASFHDAYPDPEDFFRAIAHMGYAPIMDSRSQSFGPYRVVTPNLVLQEVEVTAHDMTIYEALYQLVREPEGWRVYGVQLTRTDGVGV